MSAANFPGFPTQTRQFLAKLSAHNERDWFNERKQQYEDVVRTPALEFIAAVSQPLKKVSPHFEAVAKKTGGSLMRIYRDTRFSKDKTPYKTNIGMHFKHEAGFDAHAPGCYVHIEADSVFVGVGIWRPDRDSLLAIREAIAADPAGWKRASRGKKFADRFELSGESLQRPPKGFDKEHPLIEELKRKDFIGICHLEPQRIESPEFVAEVAGLIKTGKPLLKFLCDALELPV